VPSREAVEAIVLAGRSEGLVLDPVYTGKALAGMLVQVREGVWRGAGPLVFFHSGGAPGLFANAARLVPWLPA
jgi:1-aminocyclopropane-1-carboxylate deaminase/D-cysteine desulfhydrase-like pyridoxal-dependent ACC family enzyme